MCGIASRTIARALKLRSTLAPWGLRRADVPMSFNLFMNCPMQSDGSWSIADPISSDQGYRRREPSPGDTREDLACK